MCHSVSAFCLKVCYYYSNNLPKLHQWRSLPQTDIKQTLWLLFHCTVLWFTPPGVQER